MARTQDSSLIDQVFPGVEWIGRSEIHRSIYRQVSAEFGGPRYHKRLITHMVHAGFGAWVFDMLQEQFTGCEWLMSSEEFAKLLVVDMYRSLKGLGNSESPNKLKNPHTGNVFHRLALKDGQVVCGIRFWCNSTGPGEFDGDSPKNEGYTTVGFRFRVELIQESEGKVRAKARQKVAEAVNEYEPIVEELMISEPSDEEASTARKTLRMSTEED